MKAPVLKTISRGVVASAVVAALLLASGLALLSVFPALNLPGRPGLPSIHFPSGGQFQVVQVRYTAKASHSSDHGVGKMPRVAAWLWERLPMSLRTRLGLPSPIINTGVASDHPALSVWWAYVDPRTGNPELGPTSEVLISTDSGRQLAPIWPKPVDAGYRQIFLVNPPTDSRQLHFRLTIEDVHPVTFTIRNPAYVP